MSLQTRISALATRVSTEIKAVRAEKRDKRMSFGTGNNTTHRKDYLCMYSNATANLSGAIIIDTKVTFTNIMTRVDVTGYNYSGSSGVINLQIKFYAADSSGTSVIYNPEVVSSGSCTPSQVIIAKNSSGFASVIIRPPVGNWQYPRIAVDGLVAHVTVSPTVLDDWSIQYLTDYSAYTIQTNAPIISYVSSATRMLTYDKMTSPGATTPWFRVGTLDGVANTSGADVTFMVSGQGNIGSPTRDFTIVQAGQRSDNTVVGYAWSLGAATGWTWYTKQISTYVFEIWAKRPAYDQAQISVLSSWRFTLQLDSSTTTDPGGLVAFGTETSLVDGTDARLTNARTPTAHNHAATDITSGTLADARLPSRLWGQQPASFTNFDDCTNSGWYIGGPDPTNAPATGSAFYWGLVVDAYNYQFIVQTAMIFGYSGPVNQYKYRRIFTTTWSAWYQVEDSITSLNARYSLLGHGHALTDSNITGVLPIAQVPVVASGTVASTGVVRGDDVRVSDTGWTNVTLVNGWSGGGSTPRYRRVGRVVYIEGMVSGGTSNTIFTLPAGFRPTQDNLSFAYSDVGGVTVWTSGSVLGTVGKVALLNISFLAS